MDLSDEISNHLEWIETIAALLSSEKLSEEDYAEITSHHDCALGHWLDDEAPDELRQSPEFQQLVESHAAFHKMAGDLIDSYQQGKENAALDAEDHFLQLSHEVIEDLQALQEVTTKE